MMENIQESVKRLLDAGYQLISPVTYNDETDKQPFFVMNGKFSYKERVPIKTAKCMIEKLALHYIKTTNWHVWIMPMFVDKWKDKHKWITTK